jgi:hypothetical protein
MTDLDELRRTLDSMAGSAHDGHGVVETVRAASRRRRRRVLIRNTVAVVIAVAVAVAAGPVWARLTARATPTVGTQTTTSPPGLSRDSDQFTLQLSPSSTWRAQRFVTTPVMQYVRALRPTQAEPGQPDIGLVAVHNPGTFDPSQLLRGTPVTVEGHRAYQVEALDGPTPFQNVVRWAAIGWPDATGAWVVVSVLVALPHPTPAELLTLANQVVVRPAQHVTSPVSFGYVPNSFELTRTDQWFDIPVVSLGFGATAEPQPYGPQPLLPDPPLSVTASARGSYVDSQLDGYGKPTIVNGVKTWVWKPVQPDTYPDERGLVVETDTCQINIIAQDGAVASLDDLRKMVANATFVSCTDQSHWLPIVH